MRYICSISLIICCCLLNVELTAQSANTYTSGGAVNASSSHLEGPNVSTSYILGELVVGQMSGNSAQVQNGYHYSHFTVTPVEEASKVQLLLYPNPTSEQLHVKFEQHMEDFSSMLVLNLDGQVVKRASLQPGAEIGVIDVADLAPGMYLVKIADNKGNTLSLHKVEKLD